MRGATRGSTSTLRLTILLLILLPGLALGYVGLRGLAEREESLRTNYTATAVLVRDRLAAELARLESELDNDLTRAARSLDDPAAVSQWMTTVGARRPWLHRLFVVRADGALATSGVHDRWPRSRDDPTAGLPRVAAAVQSGETAEFQEADLEEALRRYRHGLAFTPPSSTARALVLTRIGRTLSKLRRFTAAVEAYRRVLDERLAIIDPNGLPYAVIALLQLGDAFEALNLPVERSRVERQLLQYLVDHPWDLQDGYGHYLARARQSAAADAQLQARARALTEAVAMVEWIRRSVLPRAGPEPGSRAPFTRMPGRWSIERGVEAALIGARAARPQSQEVPAAILGYEIRTDYIRGPMLADVLKTVDLGPELTIAVAPRRAAPPAPAEANTSVPLGMADLHLSIPGLQVVLLHQHGRSMDQLVARERWIYGTLIVGMVTVMIVGVGFTLRASARASELSRLKSGFVSSVSHELKTPLALIRMFGETLESGLVADESRRQEYYRIIRRESERLTHLIDNVLDIGRIDAGAKQYRLEPADLAGAVREALDAYRPLFDRAEFQVETMIPDTPLHIPMDRDAVVQALINLFQNVIKYSADRRYVSVSVEVRGREAAVAVGDHGAGIARGELARIFDPYYRVVSDGHTASPGSGLGLAIVRHTIDAHGGRIHVDSAVGEGSVFTLVLPIPEAATAVVGTATREPAGA